MAEDKYDSAPDTSSQPHTQVAGALNQHTPSYWRLALPALGVRYAGTFLKDLSKAPDKSNRYFDAAAGAWMMATTFFFANRTKHDMMNIFSETVGYELDKKPGEVKFSDLRHSSNKSIAQVCHNFYKFNGIRALVNASFFASWLPGKPLFKGWKPLRDASSLNLGMATNSAYLVSEILVRDRTFFEQLQSFVANKIDQRNALGEDIAPIELMRLFERNALDNDPSNAFNGKVSTKIWYQSQVLFERMADLMNHTYQHMPDGKASNFTLPKFLYLIGHNLIQPKNVEQSMAYINLADRYGMSALKQVVKEVRDGTQLSDALHPYPGILELSTVPQKTEPVIQKAEEKSHAQALKKHPTSYTERAINGKGNDTSLPVPL